MKQLVRVLASFRALTAVFALAALAAAQNVDVVGSTANASSGVGKAKGNSYEVTTAVTLTQAEFYLNFTGPQTLTYTVHSCPVEFGTYTMVYQSSGVVTGSGVNWYSTGTIAVPFVVGMHYIVAVSWTGSTGYYFGAGDSQAVSFGSETFGYALGLNPLPTMFSNTGNDQAIYHQRLTTSPSGGPVATVYCTAGTTSNGCVPAISWTGTPSASASSGFIIDVGGVEGAQSGLIFYGISGAVAFPWGTSTSFMCVKSPIERTPVQNSGGTFGACNGLLSIDWSAFTATTPGALGTPLTIGQHVFAQGWFRDPPSPKTTMLSDGLDFVVQP